MFPEGWFATFALDVLVSAAVALVVLSLICYLRHRYRVGLGILALLMALGCVASVLLGMSLGLRGGGGVSSILVFGSWMLLRFYKGQE